MTASIIEGVDIVQVLGEGAGQVQALKGVTMSLVGGELTLLMGPSGSGKTTLLSILGCMLTPTQGTVRVLGHSTAARGRKSSRSCVAGMWASSSSPTTCSRR